MARELTKKQKGFVKDYLDTGNGRLAAMRNYAVANEHTATVIASENLTKPDIMEYLRNHAQDAASMVYKLSQTSKQDFIKLNASKDILDRSGYGAVSKSESRSINVEVKVDNKETEALRKEYEDKLKLRLSSQ